MKKSAKVYLGIRRYIICKEEKQKDGGKENDNHYQGKRKRRV